MKNISKIILIIVIVTAALHTISAQDKSPEIKKVNVNELHWFAGCWEYSVPEREMNITEIWTKPDGGMLVGASRMVVKGKTASFEYLRVADTADGSIEYIAKPSTNPAETAFRMKSFDGNEIIFENTAHDFPQRIIYRKGDKDSIFARIEGLRNGETRGMDIPMKSITCS